MASNKQKMDALEKAFLDVDQIAEDLVRLIGNDPKYKAKAVFALQQIMTIKKDLLEVVQ
jgi:hypothetical protein